MIICANASREVDLGALVENLVDIFIGAGVLNIDDIQKLKLFQNRKIEGDPKENVQSPPEKKDPPIIEPPPEKTEDPEKELPPG